MKLSDARYIHIPGWYDVTVEIEGRAPFDYTVSPDDKAPLAAALRDAVAALGINIAPYVPPPPPTPEEQAAIDAEQQKAAAIEAIRAHARQEEFIQSFITMTTDEVIAHVEAKVTNIASAKTLLKQMAVMMLIMARREFGD